MARRLTMHFRIQTLTFDHTAPLQKEAGGMDRIHPAGCQPLA
jgi:hypothetical protein